MTDTATDLTPATDPLQPAPAVDPPAQAQGDGDPTPLQQAAPDEDAALDAELTEGAVELTTGEKLVDAQRAASINTRLREQRNKAREDLKAAQQTAGKVTDLEAQIAHLTQQIQATQPYVSAYQAMQQAAQQTVEPSQDDAEAEEYAKLLDLYTTEGKPDIGRAKRAIALFDRRAKAYAGEAVAPLQHQTVNHASAANYHTAANTTVGQVKADPAILKSVWSRLDPTVTATPDGAKHALIQAIGLTVLQGAVAAQPANRSAGGQFAKADPPGDPMFTEKAGGKDTPASDAPLDAKEQAYLKQMGITEKEYRESAKSAPWLRR